MSDTIALLPQKAYTIYGREAIEEGALKQMQIAMKLPVTVAGALMPDAHPGYGLPIGGVLATKNAVIPYGVGVDIDWFFRGRKPFRRVWYRRNTLCCQ
jgi:tRNA-splicing ligase RtcB